MKISASKKTITILSICFVLLLVGGFSFFYRDVISNGFNHGRWFVLDKYDKELPDYCEYEVGDGKVVVKCRGFLSGTPEGETPDLLCGDFQIVDKEGLGWKRFFPCLDYEDFSVHHILLKSGYYTPVDISIEYVKKGLFAYELDKISVEEMDSTVLYDEIYEKNLEARKAIGKIATQNDILYEQNSYLPVKTGIMGKYPYITYFKTLQLKDISVVGDDMKLVFSGIVKEKSVTLEVLSSKFLYSYVGEDGEFVDVMVDKNNYKEVGEGHSYQVHFLSLSEKENIDEVISNCKSEKVDEPWFEIFCSLDEKELKNSVIVDRSYYIETLLLNSGDNIKLEKFVLYSIDRL